MYIFPRNKNNALYVIAFSVVYLTLAFIFAIMYANKEYEVSKEDILEKTNAPIYYTDPHSRTYYDVVQDMSPNYYFSLYNLETPPTSIIFEQPALGDMYYDILDYYLLVFPPSWKEKYANGYVSRWSFPWIVEYNRVTCGNGLGQFKKVHIYPYAVGFKKRPINKNKEAEDAVRMALYHCIRSSDSQNEWFVGGSRFHFTESNIANKYHRTITWRTNTYDKPITIDSLWVDESNSLPFCYDYGNCRVYMRTEDHAAFYTVECDKTKRTKYKIIYCIIGVLTWIVVLFLLFFVRKRLIQKEIDAIQLSLYERLRKTCNPKNFLNPYNKEKVLLANEIYNMLSQIDSTNEEQVYSLYLKANKELEINVLDTKRLNQLEALTNPALFMNPYNEQKVLLANELYAKLRNRETLLYKEYQDIERLVEELYK